MSLRAERFINLVINFKNFYNSKMNTRVVLLLIFVCLVANWHCLSAASRLASASGRQEICCGETNTNGESNPGSRMVKSRPRIVGGSAAWPGEFPFQVGIKLRGGFCCGGVLIGEQTVLSAAHCFEPK